jgi:hypothetical protein
MLLSIRTAIVLILGVLRVLVDWLTQSRIYPRSGQRCCPASVRRVLRSKMALEAA